MDLRSVSSPTYDLIYQLLYGLAREFQPLFPNVYDYSNEKTFVSLTKLKFVHDIAD